MKTQSSNSFASNKPNDSSKSLYEILQENKVLKQVEFYEESKAEMTGRNLTDEDAKFLMAVQESKLRQEQAIKRETDAALNQFRVKHELLSREQKIQEIGIKSTEPAHVTLAKIHDKIKSTNNQTSLDSAIKSKRNLLGIAEKSKK